MIKILIYCLLFLYLYLSVVNCRKSSEICKLTNKCTAEKCEYQKECKGKFSQKCNAKYCSVKKEHCNKILNKIFWFGFFMNERFYPTIDECPTGYFFQSNHVCISEKNCTVNFILRGKTNTIKIRCPCPITHKYECGFHYCTINNVACSALDHINRTVGFNKCLNGDKKFEREIIFPLRF
jgi:hypothetical protein